jgi:hypothetical protein
MDRRFQSADFTKHQQPNQDGTLEGSRSVSAICARGRTLVVQSNKPRRERCSNGACLHMGSSGVDERDGARVGLHSLAALPIIKGDLPCLLIFLWRCRAPTLERDRCLAARCRHRTRGTIRPSRAPVCACVSARNFCCGSIKPLATSMKRYRRLFRSMCRAPAICLSVQNGQLVHRPVLVCI